MSLFSAPNVGCESIGQAGLLFSILERFALALLPQHVTQGSEVDDVVQDGNAQQGVAAAILEPRGCLIL